MVQRLELQFLVTAWNKDDPGIQASGKSRGATPQRGSKPPALRKSWTRRVGQGVLNQRRVGPHSRAEEARCARSVSVMR